MSQSLQTVALCLMLLGLALTLVSITMPQWSKNDPFDTTRDSIQTIKGLWKQCTTFAAGNWDCDDYDRLFLGLPAKLQAGRLLAIGSVACGVIGFILGIVGLDCIPAISEAATKSRMRLIAGILTLVSALFLLIATCWYANDIRRQHETDSMLILSSSSTTTKRFIFGEALFVGWAASVVNIIAGSLVTCTSCGKEEEDTAVYTYNPPNKPVSVRDYV